MRIEVGVIPKARTEIVEEVGERLYKVKVTVAPENNKANERVRKLLAEYFGISKSMVTIVGGATSHTKIIDILL